MKQISSKTAKVRNCGDRRQNTNYFAGVERRKNNYDRRRLPDRRKVKPAMSGHAKTIHNGAYVAGLIADIQNSMRASGEEARMIYGAPRAVRTANLSRGLILDKKLR